MDQMLNARPGIISARETIAQGSAGAQGKGLPDTHHINAGIPATNTRNPRIYPNVFFIDTVKRGFNNLFLLFMIIESDLSTPETFFNWRLSQHDIQYHHQGEAEGKAYGADIGVLALGIIRN